LRRQDINLDHGVIIVVRNLTRFDEGLPKTSYGKREVDMLAPVRAALAEQQVRVELNSTFLFYDRGGGPLSLKVLRGAWFRLLHLARLPERPLYKCRHTYATLLLSKRLNALYVAHQMGHSTVAMVVRHYARLDAQAGRTAMPSGWGGLWRRGLSRQKCQKFARKWWIQTLSARIVIDRELAELRAKLAMRRGGRVVEGTRLLIWRPG
jgi:integrase